MFKTTFKIITPIILVVMIIAISYNTYKKTEDVSTSPITIIPTNASIILQINDIKNLKKSLKKSVAWNQLQHLVDLESVGLRQGLVYSIAHYTRPTGSIIGTMNMTCKNYLVDASLSCRLDWQPSSLLLSLSLSSSS